MNATTAMIKDLRELTGAGPLACKNALEASTGDLDKATELLRERGLIRATEKSGREMNAGLVVVQSTDDTVVAVEVRCETDFVAFTDDFKRFVRRLADMVLADATLTDADALLNAPFADHPGKSTGDILQMLISKFDENISLHRAARRTLDGPGVVEGYVHAGDLDGNYAPLEGRVGVLVELRTPEAVNNAFLQTLAHDLALHIAAVTPQYVSPDDIPEAVVEHKRAELIAQVTVVNELNPHKERIVEGRFQKFIEDTCLLKQRFVKDDSLTVEQLLRHKSEAIGAVITVRPFARFEIGA